jgi:tetratricopeptide (TPR) repeat protein
MNRQGYLFQSPISWYSERQVWDLSPHLGKSVDPPYRPVQALCLYCHANHVDPVEHTGNQFHEPIFQGYSIGCERCHGPGELHVKRRQRGESDPGEDDGIVNPGHLQPALREAVCQQCHLQGVVRIARRGRQWFDYRPGLPMQEFWSVFAKATSLDSQKKFSSQVEQMYASRCYRGSRGKLGCISCHDPHQVPAPEQKLGYYRNRCLACHQENSCHLSPTARRMQSPGDSCVDCHMKRISSAIAHMASTDHRILRRQADEDRSAEPTLPGSNPSSWLVRLGQSPESALVLFPQDLMDTGNPETARALGLALVDLAGLKVPTSIRTQLAQSALPLLTATVQTWPDDAPAWQAQGYTLWLLDRKPEALAALETALTKAPRREEALVYAAAVSAQLGQDPAAIEYWQRALNVNPWSERSHYELAKLLVKDQQWQKALSEGREAMALNPFHLETRLVLIECHIGLGDKERARTEFNEVLSLNPLDPAALKRWFEQQMR